MNKKWIIIDPKGNVLPIEMNQDIWRELKNTNSFMSTDIIKYTNRSNLYKIISKLLKGEDNNE